MKTLISRFVPNLTQRRWRAWLTAACVAGCVSMPARAVTEPSALTGERRSYGMSWQQEIQEGAQADKEITQQMGLYDNPEVQRYVDQVGHRVLSASTFANPSTPSMYRDTKFTFRVLDSQVVNAFALPGGYVYVTRGLLSHVDNEAQLAVVLGHEIGHVAARHASQQARRTRWGQIGTIAGAILGQAVLGNRLPNIGQEVVNTGGQALQVFMLRYSREDENQADTLGVQYALNAGYAAEESARFFDALRRLSAEEGASLPTWLSTHPDPGNRAAHVQQLVTQYRLPPGTQRIVGTDEFLRHIDGIVVGDDPRQGFVLGGEFYHPTLHFQLPVANGWKVDNQPAAVVFSDPNQQGVMTLQVASAPRTHDAATQFVSQNNVQVAASGDTSLNGLPATVIVGRTNTNQGDVGVWDAFVELEGKVYSLLGYAPPQAFEGLRPTFESVASGFTPLRDPRLANVEPARLRVVRTDREAPFAAFVPTSLPPKFTADSVAIMNQVALNEPVPLGAELKIPDVRTTFATQPPVGLPNPPQPPPAPAPVAIPTPFPTQGYPAPTSQPQYPQYPGNPNPGDQPYPYPPPSSAPATPTTYPATNSYPPSTVPENYPPAQNPSPVYAPPAPAYPQSGSVYPVPQSGSSTGQVYPATPYSQNSPTFPKTPVFENK